MAHSTAVGVNPTAGHELGFGPATAYTPDLVAAGPATAGPANPQPAIFGPASSLAGTAAGILRLGIDINSGLWPATHIWCWFILDNLHRREPRTGWLLATEAGHPQPWPPVVG
ncbi:hypothetical protein RHGRI_029415 [Rhododendron griersonianum]|uniref:Uncharacterized protein n=1 Tax=Rhododendron griersonianum TaxID=479676 RepID=A0AAV6ILK0_9ERIC|nr:hypothetical protein RHGRI_029415 [Rhododendron griersonianum]